jgi:hypothetical protein
MISTAIVFIAALVMLGIAFYQSELVSWDTDVCGCVGVWGIFAASAYLLWSILRGLVVSDAEAGMVLAFALWIICRAMRKRHWPNGVFGKTDKSPLGEK